MGIYPDGTNVRQLVNLYMGNFEQQFLRTQNKLPLAWWRYIDDVFVIWTHGVPYMNSFLRELNNYHKTIKFTPDWSAQEVIFLAMRVYIKNGRMETDLHVVPTSKHQYLHTNSCHPKPCKTAIPYSQSLRIKKFFLKKSIFVFGRIAFDL